MPNQWQMLHQSPVQLIWSRKWRVNTTHVPLMFHSVHFHLYRITRIAHFERCCDRVYV